MKITETSLPEVFLIEPTVFGDSRGYFMEVWNAARFAEAGLDLRFVQDNQSRSARGVLRGLHYQEPKAQGKLVRCSRGARFDVAVDIRTGSPHFGKWYGVELSEENRLMLWIPPGFAHGFCALSEFADLAYKCTAFYDANSDRAIRWDDPEIAIAWPIATPTLSAKDAAAPRLQDALSSGMLPTYRGLGWFPPDAGS